MTGELVLTYDESINAETAVGTYSDKTLASGLTSDNYGITFIPGKVTVSKSESRPAQELQDPII